MEDAVIAAMNREHADDRIVADLFGKQYFNHVSPGAAIAGGSPAGNYGGLTVVALFGSR